MMGYSWLEKELVEEAGSLVQSIVNNSSF